MTAAWKLGSRPTPMTQSFQKNHRASGSRSECDSNSTKDEVHACFCNYESYIVGKQYTLWTTGGLGSIGQSSLENAPLHLLAYEHAVLLVCLVGLYHFGIANNPITPWISEFELLGMRPHPNSRNPIWTTGSHIVSHHFVPNSSRR